MVIKRKEFIQIGSLATASLLVPKFLKAFESKSMVLPGNKVVVILQLSGGNDGLNTVIPFRNDLYYKARPKLGIAKDTASDSNEYWTNGWMGRYLDSQCNGCDKPTQAIEIDDVLSLALKGEHIKGIAVKDPRRLYGTANEKFFRDIMKNHVDEAGEQPADYLYKTMAETLSSADYIFKQSRMHPTNAVYPTTNLGSSLKTIASLIYSEINTKVYYVSLGSFDTHINQEGQQNRLFTEMNDAIKAFVKDLKEQHRFDDVLLFSFSEFGRRVEQNASNGTDHGTANNMFMISGGLKQKGILNPMPDLSDLNEGDLKYNVDFKNVYATILNKWLKADDKSILMKQYEYLNFI